MKKFNHLLKFPVLFLLFFLATGFVSADQVNATQTISIVVTVSETTIVTVTPLTLNWTSVDPGTEGTEKAIQIENIGSTNITKIWFNNTAPSSLPFGSSNPSLHNAGNFIAIRKNQTGALHYFSNLIEYNESELIYLTLPTNYNTHGRFRSASSEYFWALQNGTSGNCSNGTFYIGVVPHNSTQDGTLTLTSCALSLTGTGTSGCRSGSLTEISSQYGSADVMVGMDGGAYTGQNYTVLVKNTCDQVTFYHWNIDAPGASSFSNNEAFSNSTIYPGGNILANVVARVPYGTPVGTKTGTLTITAQATT